MTETQEDPRTLERIYDEYTDLNTRLADRIGGLRDLVDRLEGGETTAEGQNGSPATDSSLVSRLEDQTTRLRNLNNELDHEMERLARHF